MLPTSPPSRAEAYATVRRGSKGWPVFSIQKTLSITADGDFGPQTESAVKRFQADQRLVADGLVGPSTKAALSRTACMKASASVGRLSVLNGFASGEGGMNPHAVNWSVGGGVDCGLFQLRVYGPPYDAARMRVAFDPIASGKHTISELVAWEHAHPRPHPNSPFSSFQLAVLRHNWPYAADRYYKYGALPNPDRVATWVPAGVPTWAKTWAGWCRFYVQAMGA